MAGLSLTRFCHYVHKIATFILSGVDKFVCMCKQIIKSMRGVMAKQQQARAFPLGIHLDVTTRLWRTAIERALPFTHINRPHWLALSAIEELGDGCNLKAIVGHLNSEVSTISRALKFLEQNQLIVRSSGGKDRREKGVCLTSDGRAVLARLDREAERVRQQLLAEIPADDLDTFYRVLGAIKGNALTLIYGQAVPEEFRTAETSDEKKG
ncbi:MarR family transcriptional regulator [Jejubacter calystegiae]|uniref:MarR family transcriptional regulator n=2 Tax=Enterobacteriaceae TaxID=543 RepID=A0A4P8YKC1_9ENTR|nr:MarR family transcriptional regulator [Jejubacter calystegiae]